MKFILHIIGTVIANLLGLWITIRLLPSFNFSGNFTDLFILAAVLALLPVGGAALVWLPGALYLFITDATVRGVLLATWGTFLVSLPDNFIKPLLIGKRAKLPTFFLFLGILGGLQVYGFLGILFGPLIVTLLTAFVQIYREEFSGDKNGIVNEPL